MCKSLFCYGRRCCISARYIQRTNQKIERTEKIKARKRKQQNQRLQVREDSAVAAERKRKRTTQPKLKDYFKMPDSTAADHAVAQWAIAHDIPSQALSGPYWKLMNKKLSQVSPNYVPMNPQKLNNTMLPILKTTAMDEQELHLRHQPDAGRTLTGDGATKSVPLINFLAHVPGKGVTLLSVTDCTSHMSEGGTKDALYV